MEIFVVKQAIFGFFFRIGKLFEYNPYNYNSNNDINQADFAIFFAPHTKNKASRRVFGSTWFFVIITHLSGKNEN
jgi:cytochrome c biogenesis protein ResB